MVLDYPLKDHKMILLTKRCKIYYPPWWSNYVKFFECHSCTLLKAEEMGIINSSGRKNNKSAGRSSVDKSEGEMVSHSNLLRTLQCCSCFTVFHFWISHCNATTCRRSRQEDRYWHLLEDTGRRTSEDCRDKVSDFHCRRSHCRAIPSVTQDYRYWHSKLSPCHTWEYR